MCFRIRIATLLALQKVIGNVLPRYRIPFLEVYILLDRVDSISVVRVVINSKMPFSKNIDATVGKALAILG
jgi:hypothetical protein